jgi:hypothetical protein
MSGNSFMNEFPAAASPSWAKARTEKRGFIAALKRCATQNQSFPANCEAGSAPMPNVGISPPGDMQ